MKPRKKVARRSGKPRGGRTGRRRRARGWWKWTAAAAAALAAFAAAKWFAGGDDGRGDEYVELLATGYCNCGECCGWEPDANGEPVYNYGAMKGRAKEVGRTSTGTMARFGTIAADPKRFKAGTRIYVPGYGLGRVEDVGGAIKGDHLDLWFPTHEEARRWGSRRLTARIIKE